MFKRSLAALMCAALAVGVLACSEQGDQHAEAAGSDAATQQETMQASTQVAALLAKADAVDGMQDHVVSQCSGCKLAMAGDPNHAMDVGEYSLQFCSAACKDNFAQGGEAAILALEIPEAEGHEGHGH